MEDPAASQAWISTLQHGGSGEVRAARTAMNLLRRSGRDASSQATDGEIRGKSNSRRPLEIALPPVWLPAGRPEEHHRFPPHPAS